MYKRIRSINQKPLYLWQDEWADRIFLGDNDDPDAPNTLIIEHRQISHIEETITASLETTRTQKIECTLSGRPRIIRINSGSISDGNHRLVVDNEDKRWMAETLKNYHGQLRAALPVD